MGPATWLQERRMETFIDVLGRWKASRLSQTDAAEILGMSERTFRRYCKRYEAEGLDGLIDRRTFLDEAAKFTVGGMTAAAFLKALSPEYADTESWAG